MKKLKTFIFRCYIAWFRALLRRSGVQVAANAIINKLPSVRMVKGSRIILHDDVTLTSNPRHNPLLTRPVQLRTLTPEAVIEMQKGSGMSGATIVCCTRVTIGEHTIIGPDTLIYDSEGHSYSPEIGWRGRSARTGHPVTIGSKCFIGARCIILSGVSIGDNCVVAAGTVVTADIPAGHKAYGNPAVYEPLPKVLGGPGRRRTPKTEAAN